LTARNYSAVTAACLLIRRQTFMDVGGFDGTNFAVAYNDVDLCLRLHERGLRCVYAPRAELTHYEGASRGLGGDNPAELIAFRKRWGKFRDPFYSPNLSLDGELYEIQTRRATPAIVESAPPLRVLFVTHNFSREGAPLSLFEMARGLGERGRIEPHVYCHADGPLGDLYREAGIQVHLGEHPLHDRPDLPDFDLRMAEFAAWLRDEQFDAVFANTLDSFWALHAARIAGVPSLWNIRESCDSLRAYFERFGPWMVEPALRTFDFPYRTIFVAQATRALYAPVNRRHNMSVINNGLRRDAIDRLLRNHDRAETRRRLGFPDGKIVFLILGTVCERKGQLEFAQAAARLIEAGRRDARFAIVGCRPGPYQTLLDEFVKPHAEFFHLAPETDQSLEYLTAADVFVCCSRNESYPRVILEALAGGVPIITTPVFGIAEQVSHDFSALTYAPGDVATLVEHMARLADRPEERARLCEGAARQLESLTNYDEMLGEYERLIREAAELNEASNEAYGWPQIRRGVPQTARGVL
jgi:glycosyltransferase involved in cell wall biosynthesis